jgi:hypothetical protein
MAGRIPVRLVTLVVALMATLGVLAGGAAAAGASEVIYDNVPSPLPGNFVSLGNQAYSMQELGGEVEFAGAARTKPKVTVVMSTWACQSGGVYQDTCETAKPNKKFKWPVTLNIYDVEANGAVGAKVGPAITKTFKMPYRPSEDDAECVAKGYEAGTWYDASTNACYHGMAFPITFKARVELRPREILSVSYNTSTHGPSPVGTAACSSTSAGCYYDSLNVALAQPAENTLTVGAQPTSDDYVNSTYPEMFCESGTAGTFGPASCSAFWEGGQPIFEVSAG